MEDEEDVIVEEIPVYLAKALQDNLFIFQYPIKSHNTSLSNASVVNSCVKPINQEVKIDFGINTELDTYDTFKGEQLAVAADGKSSNRSQEKRTFRSGTMDKQSFVSTKSLENADKYVAGIFQDGEVHLTPITGLLQMRPSFSYFDKEDKRAKAEQKASKESDADDEELQQVTVKFSRADNDRLKKAREKTYDYIVKKSSEEPWCETMWHGNSSAIAELEKQKLFATRSESTGHALSLSSKQYIEKLVPPERSNESLETILPSKVISRSKLKKLSLTEQIKVILKDAKMLTFNDLMSILEDCDNEITAEKVLRTLPLVAVLIRGNWVAQSDVLYPPDSVSNINGVSAENMIRGRDYVLYQFSKNSYLIRKQVILATQLPNEEVYEILSSIARLTSEKRWELPLAPDTAFEARYPDLVQRQEMFLRAKESQYHQMEHEHSPKRSRKKSLREIKTEKLTNGS